MTINLPHVAAPARRALAGAGIENLEQLADRTEAEVGELHGMGPKALTALRAALTEQGLSYRNT